MLKLLSIFLVFFFYSWNSFSCDTIHFKGYYLFEYSEELSSIDDMIFRKSALIEFSRKSNYNKGIYLFESMIVSENEFEKCEFNKSILNKLNRATRFISDSIHNVLRNIETDRIIQNGMVYKKVFVDFIAIYLGKRKVYVYRKNKIKYKKTPAFLIIDFMEIRGLE